MKKIDRKRSVRVQALIPEKLHIDTMIFTMTHGRKTTWQDLICEALEEKLDRMKKEAKNSDSGKKN